MQGRSLYQCMGGKGANQAVAAARLGADVSFVACLGEDVYGSEAISAYRSEGIDTSYVRRVKGTPTGTAAILVDDRAENSIIVISGANDELNVDDVRGAAIAIEQADVVLCQLETPVSVATEAFRTARALNRLTVLTPAPAEYVTGELLSLSNVCVLNQTEIATICEQPSAPESDDAAIRGVQLLRRRGVERVALTLGDQGVVVVDACGASHVSAVEVKAIDSTGAGDAFTAAFAVMLARGFDLIAAAEYASLVAAISVTRVGTQPSFPTALEVDNWRTLKKEPK